MGTAWSIQVYALDQAAARHAVDRAFARVEAIEQCMSDFRADSEINRLAESAPGSWRPVSAELYAVLRFSLRLARWSDGAFDPTVGPLTRLWRRAFRQRQFPARDKIRLAGRRVGYRRVALRGGREIRLAEPGIWLDLGGVAKGFALDAAGDVLDSAGFASYLIDGGGDLLLGAPPPGRRGWRVATPAGTVDTARIAIATSGSAYRFLEWEGIRYSHLIDPRTGYGLTDPRSVTVYGPTGMQADGWASAVSIMGEAAWHRLQRRYPDITLDWSAP